MVYGVVELNVVDELKSRGVRLICAATEKSISLLLPAALLPTFLLSRFRGKIHIYWNS